MSSGTGISLAGEVGEIVPARSPPNQGDELNERAQHPNKDRWEATPEEGIESPIGHHRRSNV